MPINLVPRKLRDGPQFLETGLVHPSLLFIFREHGVTHSSHEEDLCIPLRRTYPRLKNRSDTTSQDKSDNPLWTGTDFL